MSNSTAEHVSVRYWAGARAAAGLAEELLPAGPLDAVLEEAVARHPGLARVVPVASFLVDGVAADRAAGVPVPAGATLEILPPFAGG